MMFLGPAFETGRAWPTAERIAWTMMAGGAPWTTGVTSMVRAMPTQSRTTPDMTAMAFAKSGFAWIVVAATAR